MTAAGGEKSSAGPGGREAVLAALAGTAVERLFLGGPLDGQVRTMAPDQHYVVAERPVRSSFSPQTGEVEHLEVDRCTYRSMRYAHPEAGWRAVMLAPDVPDPEQALFQWLAKRWLLEAPEGTA